ncbi:MAG: lipopolysaccharide biosynthesis protein [Alphaproteobacteria bacterium]
MLGDMVQKYLLTFCNQGLLSLLNFALNIVLVRAWVPADYGIFALTIVVALTFEVLQNALINAPLSVHVPALNRHAPRAVMEIMLSTISAMLAVVAFFGGLGLGLLVFSEAQYPLLTAFGVGAFMGTQLLRVYGRAYLFAQLRPSMVAISDLTYVAVGATMVVSIWLMPDAVVPGTIFGILAGANLVALFFSFTVAGVKMRLTARWRVLRRYRESWKDSRWALAGVITTSVQSRAHVLVVTMAFGEAVFAALAAGAILFGPIRLVLQAWGMITRPFLARAVSRNDIEEIVMTNRISLAAVMAGYAVFISLLYVFWDIAEAQLYAGKYEDMEVIVVLWAIVTLLFAGRALLAVPLQAMRQFKRLAYATALGAVVSLASVIVLTFTLGFQYSIAGVGMGEAVSLAYVIYVYRQSMAKFSGNGPGRAISR